MDNDELKEIVAEMVEKMVNNDKMFTAFDITSLLRNIHGEEIRHYEVRGVVHDMFMNSSLPLDYICTSVDIPIDGKPSKAFVYHPKWKNPIEYNADEFQGEDANPFSKAQSTGSSVTTSTSTAAPVSKFARMRDGRGRICVPARVVRKAGLVPTDTVMVEISSGKLKLRPGNVISVGEVRYTVDKHFNIRISRTVVDSAGLGNTFNCSVGTDIHGNKKITVTG
jgi:hypothetical protein